MTSEANVLLHDGQTSTDYDVRVAGQVVSEGSEYVVRDLRVLQASASIYGVETRMEEAEDDAEELLKRPSNRSWAEDALVLAVIGLLEKAELAGESAP